MFWSLSQTREMVLNLADNFDPTKDVKKSDLRMLPWPGSSIIDVSVHVPWTKNKKGLGHTFALYQCPNILCPVSALGCHAAMSRSLISGPLFAYNDGAGGFKPLAPDAFLGWVDEILALAGRDRVFGHSFRIGGTTHLLMSGMLIEMVKLAGDWSSDAWKVYVKKHIVILSPHLLRVAAKAVPIRGRARFSLLSSGFWAVIALCSRLDVLRFAWLGC